MFKYICANCGMKLNSPGLCPKCESPNVKPIKHRLSPFNPLKQLEKIDENSD